MDSYLKRERVFVGTFVSVLSFVIARSLRHNWLLMCSNHCSVNLNPPPVTTAPEAYRVAIPTAERFINIIFHIKDGTLAGAAIDFVTGFLALFLLYLVVVDGLPLTREGIGVRVAAVGIFLAFLQFPISFIYFLQRPGTLPAAFFLAVAVYSLIKAKTNGWWIVLLLFATAIQAFSRADVPFIFGLALMILSCCGNLLEDFGPRRFNLMLGTGVTLIAGAVQFYLQFVRFPHLPYSTGTPIVIQYNFKWNILNVFLLAILPFLLLIIPAVKQRMRLSSVEVMAIGAALLYLPLLFTVAIVSEVRIFVPFLLTLCMVAARVSASYLVPGTGATNPRSLSEPR